MSSRNSNLCSLVQKATHASDHAYNQLNEIKNVCQKIQDKQTKVNQSNNRYNHKSELLVLSLHVLALENNGTVHQFSASFLKRFKFEIEDTVKSILTCQIEVSENYDTIIKSYTMEFPTPNWVKITFQVHKGKFYQEIEDFCNDLIHGLHDGASDGYLEGDDSIDGKEIVFDHIQKICEKDMFDYPPYWI